MQPSYDCRLHHSRSEVESISRKVACRSTLKRHVPLHGLVNRGAAHTLLTISINGATTVALVRWLANKLALDAETGVP